MTSDKAETSSSTSNASMSKRINQALDENCDVRDENHANESKNEESRLAIQKCKVVHFRQTILSEYFPKKVVEKLSDQESKSDAIVMVNFRKLVSQLLNAKVNIERLSRAAVKAKLCPELRINLERLRLDQLKLKDETKYVQRYCHKCKTMHTVSTNISTRMKCEKCATDLLYVCTKCNENIYLEYRNMRRHWKSCGGLRKSTSQGKSITLHFCADCEFFTAYYTAMQCHAKTMKHNFRDDEMVKGS